MNRYSSSLLTFVVALGLLVTGCDSTGPSDGTGTMDLRMTDQASETQTQSISKSHVTDDLDSALVTITEISAVPGESDEDDDGDADDAEPITLSEEDVEINLVDLNAGIDTTITDLEIPAGDYSQVRLGVSDDVALTFPDGSTNTADIASEELKLNFAPPFTIESSEDKVDITVNWDVENSLEGNLQGDLVITPVVNATADVASVENAEN